MHIVKTQVNIFRSANIDVCGKFCNRISEIKAD